MNLRIAGVFLLMLAGSALADDQTRRVQAALSEAGFYYGTADGKMGEETRAALRRYQIRNGMEVTGTLTEQTLSSLKIVNSDSEEKSAAPAAEDEARVVESARQPDVEPSVAVEPVRRGKSPVREFFDDTDLADASGEEQSSAVEEAQGKLARLGYYRGAPDGLPGPELETALLRFQHSVQLRLTGRLDADTRQALADAPQSVASKPFRSKSNRPPGVVLRGVWVH